MSESGRSRNHRNFPLTVYGFERSDATMEKITRRLSEALGSHASDEMMRAEKPRPRLAAIARSESEHVDCGAWRSPSRPHGRGLGAAV
jgi:hypothetical protein